MSGNEEEAEEVSEGQALWEALMDGDSAEPSGISLSDEAPMADDDDDDDSSFRDDSSSSEQSRKRDRSSSESEDEQTVSRQTFR